MATRNQHHRHGGFARTVRRFVTLRPRLWLGVATGLALEVLLPSTLSATTRATIAWDGGGVVYLIAMAQLMLFSGIDRIKARAAQQDSGRAAILAIMVAAILASLIVVVGLIGEAKQASDTGKIVHAALAAGTIVLSWLIMQIAFTIHYAHEYYQPGKDETDALRGLDFPADPAPNFWDFFYFATSIGATSQTSDVSVKSKSMRKIVTLHCVGAFVYNTMVLALTINLAASLA